jgi:hypothetical protein
VGGLAPVHLSAHGFDYLLRRFSINRLSCIHSALWFNITEIRCQKG